MGTDGARRIVNLLFTLNASRAPLATDQILSDADLGYGSRNRDSDLKKFRRDREKLAELGIFIREIQPRGASQTEESSWTIDHAATYATLGLIRADDAETVLAAIEGRLRRSDIPYRPALERIRVKIREAAGQMPEPMGDGLPTAPTPSRDPMLEAIWNAHALRRRLAFTYRNSAGEETKRTVAIYGIFSLDGQCYFVGEDDRSGDVRTFRADRVERVWRPSGSYRIPRDFDVERYLFLPFDFAPDEGDEALFRFPAGIGEGELTALTHGHGALERREDGWLWRVTVRDMDAAASFALAHAHMGMRPVSPDALLACWKTRIEKAVSAHA